MKKIIAMMLALAMMLSLAACAKEAPAEEPDTMGQMLYKEFTAIVDRGETDVNNIANELLGCGLLPFDGLSMEVEPGWLMGFTEDIVGFEKAVMFAPAIGAIPFVAYVFDLESDGDTEAFSAKLLECADPRWNICTEADETVCGSAGDLVFFVMCSNQSEEAAE